MLKPVKEIDASKIFDPINPAVRTGDAPNRRREASHVLTQSLVCRRLRRGRDGGAGGAYDLRPGGCAVPRRRRQGGGARGSLHPSRHAAVARRRDRRRHHPLPLPRARIRRRRRVPQDSGTGTGPGRRAHRQLSAGRAQRAAMDLAGRRGEGRPRRHSRASITTTIRAGNGGRSFSTSNAIGRCSTTICST